MRVRRLVVVLVGMVGTTADWCASYVRGPGGLSKRIPSVVFIVYNFYSRACSDPRLICKRSALTLRKPG